jgi:hypothetical protein
LTTGDLFSVVASTPAVQRVRECVEKGESLSLDNVSPAAQPFLAVLLSSLLPGRPVVVVTDNLKTQEVFQQDIQTWLANLPDAAGPGTVGEAGALFYPSWEVLPKLWSRWRKI